MSGPVGGDDDGDWVEAGPAARDGEPELKPPPAPALFVPPPQIDEYRLLRTLGRGGMGQVFLGHDSLLDRPVAVKFLVTASPTEQARLRFLQEARAIARLQHPNVVAIYRVGIVSGLPYLVSEFVTGSNLDSLHLPLQWQKVLRIGLDLSRGLAAVHRHGVLHRDIKPAEVVAQAQRPAASPGIPRRVSGAAERPGGSSAYTLNKKCMISPSATTYSLPSMRILPAALIEASL